jgi:hypothetical protein
MSGVANPFQERFKDEGVSSKSVRCDAEGVRLGDHPKAAIGYHFKTGH